MYKYCCEGDATATVGADAGVRGGAGGGGCGAKAGQMHAERTLALCSGGISHQASTCSSSM